MATRFYERHFQKSNNPQGFTFNELHEKLDNNNGDSQVYRTGFFYWPIKPFILLGTRWIVNYACHRLNQAGRSACIDLNENKMPKTILDI